MPTKRHLLLGVIFTLLVVTSIGAVSAQDPVTIRWWHIGVSPQILTDFNQKLADDFVAMHPNVTIEITALENDAFKTRLATVMQSGDPPDIFHSWGGGVLSNFGNAGLLRDITPEMTANDNEWKNSITAQAALDLYKVGDAYHGVPLDWGAVGMWYNKALFAQAGIEAPPVTWAELLEDVDKLKAAGITPIALGEQERWPGHFWWVYLAMRLGGKEAFDAAYSRTGSFADPSFVQAGELLAELVAKEPFPEGFLALTYPQEAGVMGNGQAAMELQGQWAPGAYAGNSDNTVAQDDNLGWFPFPMVEGGAGDPSDTMGGGNGYAVGVNAPDEAVEFLRYLSSPEVQMGFMELNIGFVPVTAEAEATLTDPLLLDVMAARNGAKYFQLYYDQFLPPALAGAVADATEGIFAQTLTPEEAANNIEAVAAVELAS